MHVVLVEVHVEVDAEVVEARLDVREHEVDAHLAEHLLLLVARDVEQVARVERHHARRDVGDVVAAVAVFRRGLLEVAREQAAREAVDLRAVVVEVVLAGHFGALRLEDAGEAVANGGPAHAADVNRPGGVRRDELEVDAHARVQIPVPVVGSGLDDGLRECAGGGRVEGDVDEAGARDIHGGDTVECADLGGEFRRELARVDAERLRKLECDARRPVAVVTVLRALEHDVGRRRRAAASLRNARRDGEDGGRQVGGIHDAQAYRRPAERPAGVAPSEARSAMTHNGGMQPGSNRHLTIATAAALILVLSGCVDEPAPVPTPTVSATPTPTETAGGSTPTPTPTTEPLAIDCVSLVPADAFDMLFKDFTLVPNYVPPNASLFTEVLNWNGTVCGWTATDGTVVTVGIAELDAETLDAKANELVVSSHSVPTYGVEGYFQVASGVGEAQAFSDPYWIVATSTAFAEPGEVAPIMAAVLERLG